MTPDLLAEYIFKTGIIIILLYFIFVFIFSSFKD